jgi:hypothetical protein
MDLGFSDSPSVCVGDVNGDGLDDIVSNGTLTSGNVYEIKNNSIIIRSFFTKDKHINFFEIIKVEKVGIWPLSYIKIYLINGRKVNILPLDNQNIFFITLNEGLSKKVP